MAGEFCWPLALIEKPSYFEYDPPAILKGDKRETEPKEVCSCSRPFQLTAKIVRNLKPCHFICVKSQADNPPK